MIIECQSCHARFRLDATKIRGKGARVKCRRCGDNIIVLLQGRQEDTSPATGPGGFLDLGSAVRDSLSDPPPGTAPGSAKPPPDNLIPFPGPARATELSSPFRPEAAASGEPIPLTGNAGGKDEVVLAFEQLLTGTAESPLPEAPPPVQAEEGASAEEPPAGISTAELLAPPEPGTDEEKGVPAPVQWTVESGLGEILDLPPPETSRRTADEEATPLPEGGGFLLSDSDTLDFLTAGRRQEERPAAGESGATDISSLLSAVPVDEAASSLRTPPPAGTTNGGAVAAADPSPREEPAPRTASPPDMALEGNETPIALPPDVHVPPLREPAPQTPRIETRPSSREESPRPRAASSPGWVVAAVVAVLALAAIGYFGFTPSGRKTVETVAPRAAALLGGKPAETRGPVYDVRNVIGYYDTGAGARRILVIKGQVTNLSAMEKSGIRVFATILNNTEQALAAQAVYAGNVIPVERLRKIDPAGAAKILDNRFGEGLANMHVGPGKSVPFMVVFFDAPENIDSYRLEARDSD